jgi:hypothetical protein
MTIPLSEAMLLGLGEIRFRNDLYLFVEHGTCSGCLIGAAMYAVGEKRFALEKVEEIWPWTKWYGANWTCPHCKMRWKDCSMGIATVFTHLAKHYERDQMSAQEIADYIHTLEPKELPTELEAECLQEKSRQPLPL